ncbi:hypothetical protein K0M31_010134 [Melipona bicolor]|nr:hypothetical protein K0M31_010134 [Melipona bicolor]
MDERSRKLQKGGSGTKGARTVEQRADNGPRQKHRGKEDRGGGGEGSLGYPAASLRS